jgi:hypothetical protein
MCASEVSGIDPDILALVSYFEVTSCTAFETASDVLVIQHVGPTLSVTKTQRAST